MHANRALAVTTLSLLMNCLALAQQAAPPPEGSRFAASFATQGGQEVGKLFDNDLNSYMVGGGNTAGGVVSVTIRFAEPVANLGGIETGSSDPFRNYFPREIEFWGDSNGDGRCDTRLGSTRNLGPANESIARHAFDARLEACHALELRVVDQNVTGAKRAFRMNELRLIANPQLPVATPTPNSYRILNFEAPLPTGTTASVNFATEKNAGVEALLDNDPKTIMSGAQGTAQKDKPVSVFLRFPEPAKDVVALRLGGSDPFRNYVWEEMQVYADTTGDGTYDTLAGTFTGGGAGAKRFRDALPTVHGFELRVTKQNYRLHNALETELTTTLEAKLFSSFDPKKQTPVVTRSVPVTLPPHGDVVVPVNFGRLGYGHYEAALAVDGEGVQARTTDQVAVLTLNGKRVNQSPMWFGSQHPAGWIADEENRFVMKHVVAGLGLDAYRSGRPDQDRRLLLDTGLLLAAGFGGVPPELRQPNQKNDARGEPTDYSKYYEHVVEEARKEYLPYADRILSVEFYNEPDLPGFEYLPEIDTYLKMHEVFRRGFREVIPGVKIGTGGNTVQHRKEKADFNRRMYTELATETDVALWHAHGSIENYVTRHRLVEHWTEQGGRPRSQQLLGNSEAGLPAGGSAHGRLDQADNLVKKIGWAKSQPNSYFYIWFTTTDTYDPQGGYLHNENWGMATANQRLKASGQAYNELIRKLANTTGLGEVDLDGRLQSVAFERADGSRVWLAWPRERGVALRLRLAASGPVTVTDMFGGAQQLTPRGGVSCFDGNGYPMYLEAGKGVTLAPATTPKFVQFPGTRGVAPGSTLQLPVTLTNTFGRDATLELTLADEAGRTLAQATTPVAKDATAEATLAWDVPADQPYGSIGARVHVRSESPGLVDETLPLTLVVAEQAVRAEGFTIDGKPDAIKGAVPIVLDDARQMQDLVFDPGTPMWAGPEDLSVSATFAHDGKGLYVCFDVRDQTHKPGAAAANLWAADSIQLAIVANGAHTEVGFTEAEGGFGWRWLAPNAADANRKLETPVAARRQGDHTIYEAYLPFEALGIQYEPGTALRATFLVNEDDGRARVRLAKWFDGIATIKAADRMGHLLLQ